MKEGSKRGGANHPHNQKYTPKKTTPSTATTTTLSTSLRHSSTTSSTATSSSTISGGGFVKYLPQDEAVAAGLREVGGSDPLESQRVVDLLNRRLSALLSLPPRDFWARVAKDSSLHGFLESFLQFRSRWYDFPYRGVRGIVAGVIVGEIELSKRVFMVLYRLSSNRDPGARAADSLSPKDHTALLQETKLLDMSKLFDICAIYGHENEDLTRALVLNALNAQPWIQDEITSALSHFLNIVHTMHQRCSASLEVLGSSLGNGDHGSSRLHEDYLEVMDFINDAIVSMDAFVCAYKPAAVVFSCPVETRLGNFEHGIESTHATVPQLIVTGKLYIGSGNDDLLNTLAKLHDSLLPSFQRGFRIIFTSEKGGVEEKNRETLSNIILSLKMLSIRIAKFGWKLLDICYLSDEVFNGEFSLPNFTKMFPAKVEDPGIRADILVQTFREINGGYSHFEEGHGKETFLQRVDKENRILERVELLQKTGWVALDDEQFQYFTGIMKYPWDTNTQMPNAPISSAIKKLQVDEDIAIIESKISQIKDIFPDYANGFLSACLEVYNQNPEEVIQHILEGDLHPDLQLLDPTQEIISPPKPSTLSKNDKGKGKLIESIPPSSMSMLPKNRDRQSQAPSISSSSTGRFVRKSTVVSPDSVTLDCRDERDLAKTSALISQQLEYDDEYDDSFDDLGLGVPDSGFDETESGGERLNSAPSDSSKWGSRNKPQFFVKDGKNYSYKVKDSVGVANFNEAAIINQVQKEQIHGLGRGGNVPLGAVKKMTEWNVEREDEGDGDDVAESGGRGVPGNFRGRGRRGGGGGGRSNHYRKDRAMKKHFTGVSGF